MYDPGKLRAGDAILVQGRPSWSLGGLLTEVIEWATVSPLDHAVIVGEDGPRLCLYEALWSVTRSPLDKYAARGFAYRVSGATEEQGRAAGAWAAERLGNRYGLAELLEDGERYILHVPVSRRADPQHYTCSGLVAAAWRAAGVLLTYEPMPSPASLSYSPLLVGPRPWIRGGANA